LYQNKRATFYKVAATFYEVAIVFKPPNFSAFFLLQGEGANAFVRRTNTVKKANDLAGGAKKAARERTASSRGIAGRWALRIGRGQSPIAGGI
jgi:hypothetical protein